MAAGFVVTLVSGGVLLGLLGPIVAGVFAFSLSFMWRSLQMRELVHKADVSGVSAPMWFLNFAGLSTWATHGVFIGNSFLVASSTVLAAFALLIAVTVTVRRRRSVSAAGDLSR